MRRRRAFSLVEVAFAATLLLLVASAVTLVVAKTMSARAAVGVRAELIVAVDAAVNELATNDFRDLVGDVFVPPSRCPGDEHLGMAAVSCFDLGPTTAQGTWSVAPVPSPSSHVELVVVSLTASVGSDVSVTRSRTVSAPGPDVAADPVVRVRVTSEDGPYMGRIHILDRDNLLSVVSGELSASGVALLDVPRGRCTESEPCRIGLVAGPEFATDGEWWLTAPDVVGEASLVVAAPGEVTQLSASVIAPAAVVVDVMAEGTTRDPADLPSASGGSFELVADAGVTYGVHTFTGDGTFTVPAEPLEVEYLVVAGAGGVGPDGQPGSPGTTRTGRTVVFGDVDVSAGASAAVAAGDGRGRDGAPSVFGSVRAPGGRGGEPTSDDADVVTTGDGGQLFMVGEEDVTSDAAVAATSPPWFSASAVDTGADGVVMVRYNLGGHLDADRFVPRARVPQPASVCLWAYFFDGVGEHEVPVCNDAAGRLVLDIYNADPDDPSVVLALPPGVDVRFSVDRADKVCGAPGQHGVGQDGWVPAPVCTSWTWGVPAYVDVDGERHEFGEFPLTSTPVDAGRPERAVVFAGPQARPAAGFDGQPLWANPREFGACVTTMSCTALTELVPEDELCPNQHCLAVRKPRVAAPVHGTAQVPGARIDGPFTDFDVAVVDDGGSPVVVSVTELPQHGTLTRLVDIAGVDAADPVRLGESFAPTDPGGGSLRFRYIGERSDEFTLMAANDVPGGDVEVRVALWDDPEPYAVRSAPVTVTQGGHATLEVLVTGTDGEPFPDAEVYATSETLDVADVTVSGSDGVAHLDVTSGAVEAGVHTVEVWAAGVPVDIVDVVVVPSAAEVTFTGPAHSAQGEQVSFELAAFDLAGEPVSDVLVSAALTLPWKDGFGQPGGADTDVDVSERWQVGWFAPAATGTHTFELSSDTPSGVWLGLPEQHHDPADDPLLTADGSTRSVAVELSADVNYPMWLKGEPDVRLTVDTPTATAQVPAERWVRSLPGWVGPLPRENLPDVQCVTELDGRCTAAFPDAPLPSGDYQIEVSSGQFTTTTPFTLTPTPSSLRWSGPDRSLAGAAVVVELEVVDAHGRPTTAVDPAVDVPDGVFVDVVATNTSSGTPVHEVRFTFADDVSGDVTAVAVAGSAAAAHTINVVPPPERLDVAALHPVLPGQLSTVDVVVVDADGFGVPGVRVTARSPVDVLVVGTESGPDGVARLPVWTSAAVHETEVVVLAAQFGLQERTVVVAPSPPASVAVSGTLTPGGTGELLVRVTDAAGVGVHGAKVSTSELGAFGGVQVTDTSGVATLPFDVASDLQPGVRRAAVTVSSAGETVTRTVPVVVTGVPGQLVVPDVVFAERDARAAVDVTVLDDAGVGVAGVPVTVETSTFGSSASYSGPDGQVTVYLDVPGDAPLDVSEVTVRAGTVTEQVRVRTVER